MKKIFFITTIVALLGANAFADNGDKKKESSAHVSSAVTRQFQSDFSGAQNVKWTVNYDFQKVDFTVNSEKMTAFYKFNGDFMGLTHTLDAKAIPANAMEKIHNQYKGYTIGDVIVLQTNEATNPDVDPVAYFVDLKKNDKEVLVRITQNANLEFFQQVK